MQTPNSLGIGDGRAPGFFVMKRGCEKNDLHFSQPPFVYINFHGNWLNDSLLPASTSFRAMLHVVMNDNAFRSIEALSPEISHRDEVYTIVE